MFRVGVPFVVVVVLMSLAVVREGWGGVTSNPS